MLSSFVTNDCFLDVFWCAPQVTHHKLCPSAFPTRDSKGNKLRKWAPNKLSRLSPRGTTLILHVPNCMLCALFYLPCIASQLSCAGAGCTAACVRRAHPFNGLCVQPCSRWDMIIDICTLQAMKSNIFEYACMYLQYISLCKKAGKAYCENEKWHAI